MNNIESLIKYVKDHSDNFLGSKATLKENETFEYMYDLLIETLEKQLTNGWIPVEKELPKFTDDYLVSVTISTSFGDFDTVRTLPFYRRDGKGGWLLPENFDEVWKVRAWRELPEPYKELATDNNVVTKSGKDNNVLTIGDKIREQQVTCIHDRKFMQSWDN